MGEASAVRWTGKKSFSGQLVGPYGDDKCRTLDHNAIGGIFLPVVVPIEAADAESGKTVYSEPAVSSTVKCRSMRADKTGATINEAYWYGYSIGAANAGEL